MTPKAALLASARRVLGSATFTASPGWAEAARSWCLYYDSRVNGCTFDAAYVLRKADPSEAITAWLAEYEAFPPEPYPTQVSHIRS